MNINSPGSITIAGVSVLESPRPIDPQKGPRNIVFDANLCIVKGSQTVTMALLRYFAPNEMTSDIQNMADKPFQKAFIVANIASITPNSISTFMSGFEASDYAFVGDISHLIPFDGDANMKTNPYITVTGSVTKFNSENRSFTMTPTQYIVLTHTTSPFPIQAHFADPNSKRWGPEGPKVAVGSTITLGGSLQRVVREHSIDKAFLLAQIEVSNIAYLGSTRSNLPTTHIQDGSPKNRKRWNWDDLQKSSQDSQPYPSSSHSQGKRKTTDDDSEDDHNMKRQNTTIDRKPTE